MAATKKDKKVKDEKQKKPREPGLLWEKNKEWTTRALEYLTNNPPVHIKLFSDSTSKAKEEGRPKVSNSEGRLIQYQNLAEHIFEGTEHEEEFKVNPVKFGKSTQQHFSRLKTQYSAQVKRLKTTGGGLLEGEAYTNIFDLITAEWEFFPTLHGFWCELPNYNPVGVSDSSPGQDHSQRAADLFQSKTTAANKDELERSENDFDVGDTSDIDGDSGDKTSSAASELDGNDEEAEDEEFQTPARHMLQTSLSSHSLPPPSISQVKKEKEQKLFSRSATPSRGNSSSKKRTALDTFEENQASEQAAEVQRQKDLYTYRMKKLDLDAQKLQLEKERHAAKKRKMELDAKKAEWEVERDCMRDKQVNLLMSLVMNQRSGASRSFPAPIPMHVDNDIDFLNDPVMTAHATQPWNIEDSFPVQQQVSQSSSCTGVGNLEGSLTAELNSTDDNYM